MCVCVPSFIHNTQFDNNYTEAEAAATEAEAAATEAATTNPKASVSFFPLFLIK